MNVREDLPERFRKHYRDKLDYWIDQLKRWGTGQPRTIKVYESSSRKWITLRAHMRRTVILIHPDDAASWGLADKHFGDQA